MSAPRDRRLAWTTERDGVLVMGADPGIPRVLSGLAGISWLRWCTRGVPLLPAFAADTGMQVGQPGAGRKPNALGGLATGSEAFRRASFNAGTARRHCQVPVLGPLGLWGESRNKGCP